MKIKNGDTDFSPEEFAALWGCDPCYDHPPRIPGDGYLFYNFSSEIQVRDREYLENLLGAINRTIKDVQEQGGREEDGRGLEQLGDYVQDLIAKL